MICTDYLSSMIYLWIDNDWSRLRIMNSWEFTNGWGGIWTLVFIKETRQYHWDKIFLAWIVTSKLILSLRIYMEEVLWAPNNPNQHRKMVDRDIFFSLTLRMEGRRWGKKKGKQVTEMYCIFPGNCTFYSPLLSFQLLEFQTYS